VYRDIRNGRRVGENPRVATVCVEWGSVVLAGGWSQRLFLGWGGACCLGVARGVDMLVGFTHPTDAI